MNNTGDMDMGKLMSQLQAQVMQAQEMLSTITSEGNSGAGMVRAMVNGKFDLIGLSISKEAMVDKEILEDLILAAVADARKNVEDKTKKSMGLPGAS